MQCVTAHPLRASGLKSSPRHPVAVSSASVSAVKSPALPSTRATVAAGCNAVHGHPVCVNVLHAIYRPPTFLFCFVSAHIPHTAPHTVSTSDATLLIGHLQRHALALSTPILTPAFIVLFSVSLLSALQNNLMHHPCPENNSRAPAMAPCTRVRMSFAPSSASCIKTSRCSAGRVPGATAQAGRRGSFATSCRTAWPA